MNTERKGFTVGSQVIVVLDFNGAYDNIEGTVSKADRDYVWIGKEAYSRAYAFPIEMKEEVLSVIAQRKALMKAYNDSMALVYALTNKRANGDY